MKKQINALMLAVGIAAFSALTSCNQNRQNSSQQKLDSLAAEPESLSIEAMQETNDFQNAKLDIKNVKSEIAGDSVKLTFDFDVQNYELTKQTEDGHKEHTANSAEGQHIHFILDNKPYVALYKPTHSVTLAKNSEHVLLCFLSRSYHLSLKTPDASVLVKFKVDANGKYVKAEDPMDPMLFYSRPKGEYKGADTENLLLDFYVKNLNLSPNDYKVKVDVGDTTFTVDSWKPYLIKGAKAGDLEVKLSLIDPKGKEVGGTYGEIERTSKITP